MPTMRPAVPADVPAVLVLFERTDVREFGSMQMDETALLGPLTAPGTEAVLLEDGPRGVVGYAHLAADGQVETAADEAADQAVLLGLVLRRAAERGIGHLEHWTGPHEDSPTAALLAAHGFLPVRRAWHLSRSGPAPLPVLPDGVAWRPFDRDRDGRDAHALVQRAFAGSFGSHEHTFEEWAHLVLDRGADVLCLVEDDRLVAVATHLDRLGAGHVGQLAVDPAQRGRGLALALLHEAFRRDAAQGRPTTLGVDGENARARRLYDKAGMRVEWEFRRWERDVPPARPA